MLILLILHLKSKSVILMSLIFSYEFLSSLDIEFVSTDSISLVDFRFFSEVDLIDYKPSSLGPIESSSVDYALTTPDVEDNKDAYVFAKVTCIGSFLLNMILMLLFLGDRICSWINNCLLTSPCCSSRNCICMCPARAYEPDAGFHAFSSLYKPSSLFSLSLILVSFFLCNLTPFTLRRCSLSFFVFLMFLALCLGPFLAWN